MARVAGVNVILSSVRRENSGAALAESDTWVARTFAGTTEDDLVAVGKKGARFTSGKEDGLCAVASEFEKTAGGGFGWAGDGACCEDVADLQIAAVAGVMGDELGWCPIEVASVGFAEKKWVKLVVAHRFCCKKNFQFYIQTSLLLVGGGLEVGKRFRIGDRPRRCWSMKRFESGHGSNPGRYCGGEVFCEKGTEGLILPGLNVAGGPVVEETDAEEVMIGLGDGDGCAEQTGLADIKR